MEKEKPDENPLDLDPFLFFAVMLGTLIVKSEVVECSEEECRPEY